VRVFLERHIPLDLCILFQSFPVVTILSLRVSSIEELK
jgi:hypothetical protein